jgi:hypothetical protein
MKRLLDADVPGPNKRNPRDVEITRLLPEHIDQIASYSLEALVIMAQSQTWWLEELQKNRGRLIVDHAEWHPALRSLVQETFAKAQATPLALELPLSMSEEGGEPVMIPWPLLVQNWVRWNSWFHAMPAVLLASDATAAKWTTTFDVFDALLLSRAGTVRGKALMATLLTDMLRILDDFSDDMMIDSGLMISYLALLELALRVHWQEAGDTAPAVLLLSFLTSRDGDDFLSSFGDMNVDDGRASEILESLRKTLPQFFLTANVPAVYLTKIYRLSPGPDDEAFATLRGQLDLPNPLRFAVDSQTVPITLGMCKRIGRFVVAYVELIAEGVMTKTEMKDYVLWPCAQGLFGGPWRAYWTLINPLLRNATQE